MAERNYQIWPGATVQLLNKNTAPSVFSGFLTRLLKPLPVKRYLLQRNIPNESLSKDISIQSTVESPSKHCLRKKVKILQHRLKRKDIQIKTLKI
ncbi:Hypothetical protein CINCED_3A024799 [Cinara cedri]|uniref:Uncharacterized protein n=1 Tax=Cinara cedri TaxID=506608 RepID=A0A5E4N2D3_9HEMI|nr:Hypothetical protein CINCED_3A024799 [Cinara cedri]